MKRQLAVLDDSSPLGSLGLGMDNFPTIKQAQSVSLNNNAPMLSGKTSILSGDTVTLTLDNFDVFTTYSVTFKGESLTLTGRTVVFTPVSSGELRVSSQMGIARVTIEVSYPEISGVYTQLEDGPGTRQVHSVVAKGDVFYIVGGKDTANYNANELSDIWSYDTQQEQWSTIVPETSSGRTAQSAAMVDDTIFMFSGYLARSSVKYSLTTGGWDSITYRPEWRQQSTAVTYGGKVYFLAGKGNANTLRDFWEYTPAGDGVEEQWLSLTTGPGNRYGHSAVVIDNKMYVYGGRNSSYFDDLWVYSFETKQWQELAKGPTARAYHSAAAVSGKMYVFGGYSGSPSDELWVYDPQTNNWEQLQSGAGKRYYHSLVGIDGKLYLFGGYDNSPSTYYGDLWLIE